MSFIKNYQKTKCAQIDLDDGNRVLVSYGTLDIRIFKLGFLLIPNGTIHIFSNQFTYNLTQKIGYDMSKDIVMIVCNELVGSHSLEELKNRCVDLESNKDFLNKI